MLLYTRNLIPKIPARILRKHCQITFLRTFGSRRPPTTVFLHLFWVHLTINFCICVQCESFGSFRIWGLSRFYGINANISLSVSFYWLQLTPPSGILAWSFTFRWISSHINIISQRPSNHHDKLLLILSGVVVIIMSLLFTLKSLSHVSKFPPNRCRSHQGSPWMSSNFSTTIGG
jgi:hypothetical protein